jgi:hypothetical protein
LTHGGRDVAPRATEKEYEAVTVLVWYCKLLKYAAELVEFSFSYLQTFTAYTPQAFKNPEISLLNTSVCILYNIRSPHHFTSKTSTRWIPLYDYSRDFFHHNTAAQIPF